MVGQLRGPLDCPSMVRSFVGIEGPRWMGLVSVEDSVGLVVPTDRSQVSVGYFEVVVWAMVVVVRGGLEGEVVLGGMEEEGRRVILLSL